MEHKEDLRVIKTKKIIKEVFLSLVEERGYENVTITDIAQAAYINRNTFYLHYDDKQDLMESIITEMGASVNEKFTSFLAKYPIDDKRITKTLLRIGIRKILYIIDEEIELIRILLLDDSLKEFYNKINASLKNTVATYLHIKNYKKSIYFEYSFEGAFGVIKQWIIYYSYSLNETSKILADLVYNDLYLHNEN